jgi:hypothetical protein
MTVTEEKMHHDEAHNAARLLARAFAADPVITYFLNGPLRCRFAFPAFFRAIIREHVEGGRVYSGL